MYVVADRPWARDHRAMSRPEPRRIVVLAFPGAQALDFVGPLEVLNVAEPAAGLLPARARHPRRRALRDQQRTAGLAGSFAGDDSAPRPGGRAQFSTPLSAQTAERRPLRDVQNYVRATPAADLSVERIAQRAHMSTRNFARAFSREVGVTPAAFVESVRLEHAKQLLEATSEPVDQVATSCGFGTSETQRRVFSRRLGVSPAHYRDRFRTASQEAA